MKRFRKSLPRTTDRKDRVELIPLQRWLLLFHPSADVDDGDHGMRDGDDDRGRLLAY